MTTIIVQTIKNVKIKGIFSSASVKLAGQERSAIKVWIKS